MAITQWITSESNGLQITRYVNFVPFNENVIDVIPLRNIKDSVSVAVCFSGEGFSFSDTDRFYATFNLSYYFPDNGKRYSFAYKCNLKNNEYSTSIEEETLSTGDLYYAEEVFDRSNYNSRSISPTIEISNFNIEHEWYESDVIVDSQTYYDTSIQTIGSCKYILDKPPSFDCEISSYLNISEYSSVVFDLKNIKTYYKAGLSSISVCLSDRFGNKYTKSTEYPFEPSETCIYNDVTLSINLYPSVYITFIPTINLVDTRGQITSIELDQIMAIRYESPIISNLSFTRCDGNGISSDEGTFCRIKADIQYVDFEGNKKLSKPKLLKDDGTEINTTWYKTFNDNNGTNTLLEEINWDAEDFIPEKNMTVYGLTSNYVFDKNETYRMRLKISDTISDGYSVMEILAVAFYTVDFKAGGHGVAFGQPAMEDGFHCSMPSYFKEGLYIRDNGADIPILDKLKQHFLCQADEPEDQLIGGIWFGGS